MNTNSNDKTILVVDDNPTNLAILSETLTNYGFQVAIATDGESALEQVEYIPPDLILLDVMMPGIGGFETCRRLKTHPQMSHIPVIFMTALDDVERLRCNSSAGKGAEFVIELPLQQPEKLWGNVSIAQPAAILNGL